MYKYINLGSHIESTGERRVTTLDNSMVKMASNDIQDFWNNLEKDPEKSYLHVLAMTAIGWYSCNNNGDAFYEEDLIKYHPTFVSDANLFMLHKNKDPKKGHGKPVFSFYNHNMHRVELIIAVDKETSPDIVRSIENDEDIAVSMGARVKNDVCSICGNVAKNRKEYCDCLRYNMKKILKDGRQVYAINPGPLTFFDISVVNRPADKTAWALQKAASEIPGNQWEDGMTSIERGEVIMDRHEKLAAISKMGEMVKDLDGKVLKSKSMDFPQMEFNDMKDIPARPGCLLKSILASGIAPSLGEMSFISGRHAMGEDFSEDHIPDILGSLPSALKMMESNPDFLESAISEIMRDDGGEPISGKAIIAIKPVAKKRITLFKNLAEPEDVENLEKAASDALSQLPIAPDLPPEVSNRPLPSQAVDNMMTRSMSTKGPAMTSKYTVQGEDGKTYQTNRGAAMAAQNIEAPPRLLKGALGAALGLAALGTGVSNAKLSEKLLLSPVLAALSAGALNSASKQEVVETDQGAEVPVSSAFSEVPTKEAMMYKQASTAKYMAGALGSAVPAALGLDYLYNKKIKHRKDPYYDQRVKGLDKAGKKVIDHPFSSITGGAVAGSALKHLVKAKLG